MLLFVLSLISPVIAKARRFSYVLISMVLGIVTNERLIDVWDERGGSDGGWVDNTNLLVRDQYQFILYQVREGLVTMSDVERLVLW
jgi:hypothetical protein